MDIKSLINKVIASKGILRVPSWWMKKLLTEIIGYIDSRDSANKASINKVKNDADSKIINLESKTNSKVTTLENTTYSKISTINNKLSSVESRIYTIYEELKTIPLTKTFRIETGRYSIDFWVDSTYVKMPANTKKTFKFTNYFQIGKNYPGNKGVVAVRLLFTDTSTITNMSYMFWYCTNLTSLDLSSFNTSKVTNMSNMFKSCPSLTSLDLSSFNTSKVTNMSSMFESCTNLTSLDVTSFDTSKVTDMSRMFASCTNLTSLDVTSFDTSKVTDMNNILTGCSSLTSLILGPNFFKTPIESIIYISSPSKWTNGTVITSLVTNSYDRASAGLPTITLWLHANTKAVLSDEQKAAITSKGYTIA